jgi:hypothetical protein
MTVYRNRRGINFADICRIAGVPELAFLGGNAYFLDPTNGNDANPGNRPDLAVKTHAVAYALLTAGQHDVLFVISGGSSLTLPSAGSIAWAKDYTHLVGLCAPSGISNRARYFATAGQDLTPFATFSATGCLFKNLLLFHGLDSADSEVCANVTGGRNKFSNVHFAGIGHATQGDDAGAVSLQLSGAEENLFERCTIGLDTIARSAANCEIKFSNAAKRNQFKDCLVLSYADSADHLMVSAAGAAGDIDRFNSFENTLFHNSPNVGSQADLTTAFSCHASLGGSFILRNCTFTGVTDIDSDDTGKVLIDGAAPTAATSGIAVATAA